MIFNNERCLPAITGSHLYTSHLDATAPLSASTPFMMSWGCFLRESHQRHVPVSFLVSYIFNTVEPMSVFAKHLLNVVLLQLGLRLITFAHP